MGVATNVGQLKKHVGHTFLWGPILPPVPEEAHAPRRVAEEESAAVDVVALAEDEVHVGCDVGGQQEMLQPGKRVGTCT